ncbi:hypothetical protein [Sinosporangium siamense]|uniref:Uncharacterized protein n=1 Tax=Sinosporangium siamense TaxID=1367973 RepID=A0A919RJF3_9ACTN|nr:hypothetical protein [Sinosporangium siamense]GII93935.1 hypothetical protein Ssi02_41660 [Sinosporangium siamense]
MTGTKNSIGSTIRTANVTAASTSTNAGTAHQAGAFAARGRGARASTRKPA